MSTSAFGVEHGDIYKGNSEREKHYGRMAGATGVTGGLLGANAIGSGVVGHLEARGKDPMGFVHAEHGARKVSHERRMKILKPMADAHRWQAKTLGGIGAAALATSGAYKYKQKKERKARAVAKAYNVQEHKGARRATDVAAGAGAVGTGALAVRKVPGFAHMLSNQADEWGKEAIGAHHVIAGKHRGAIDASKAELKAAHRTRKIGARVYAVKKPAAVALMGSTAAGGAGLYELGRHATKRKKG